MSRPELPPLSILAAWRRRGDTKTYDALWSAAGWEACAERLLRERPNCMTATYTPDAEEVHLRSAARKRKVTLIPYLKAGPELVLDLSARQRVREYIRRADEAIAADGVALLLVLAEEDRQKASTVRGDVERSRRPPGTRAPAGSWAAFR